MDGIQYTLEILDNAFIVRVSLVFTSTKEQFNGLRDLWIKESQVGVNCLLIQ